MIKFMTGDMFAGDAEALVNTVNCVGAMGKGVAEQVKLRWPKIYDRYRRDCGIGLDCSGYRDAQFGPRRDQEAPPCCAPGRECAVHLVRPGVVKLRPTGQSGIRWVIDLPTKRHWCQDSALVDVQVGVEAMAKLLEATGIRSVSMTAPGCGNGKLDWPKAVRPLVMRALDPIPTDVRVYAPGP